MVISIDDATEKAYNRVRDVLLRSHIEFTYQKGEYIVPNLRYCYDYILREAGEVLRGTPYFIRYNLENTSFRIEFQFKRNGILK